MSKWIKADPDDIKVGDEVRMVDAFSMFQISGKTSPSKIGICVGGIDFTEAPECRTWFVRKPKKAKPLTRPDEPPYGVLFRVDRSGIDYCRAATAAYVPVHGELRWRWDQITKPGDTITLLELTEKGDKKDGGV